MVPLRLRIEDSFFLPEERDGYWVSAEMKKVWAVELDLLNAFAQVCSEYHLKWFAHAGTMLGAVRHHGFIPWDDDIDVMMPRDDYNRLIEIGPQVFSSPYFLQNEESDHFFCRVFSRLRNNDTTAIQIREKEYCFPYNQGIFIDIFPLDNIPDNQIELTPFLDQIHFYESHEWIMRNMVHFYRPKKGKGLSKRLNYYLKHIWFKYFARREGDYKELLRAHVELMTAYNKSETQRIGEIVISPLGRHIWEKEWLLSPVYVPFEMLSIPIPIGYNQCLTASYGEDWQSPKQQGNYHGQIIFDTNRPYTEYLNNN